MIMHEYSISSYLFYCFVHLFICYFCTLALDKHQLTMHQLNQIVVPRIQAKWENVAYSMGCEIYYVEAIKKDYPHDSEQCCQHLLSKWLKTSKHPTWSKLLEYIEKVNDLVAVAEEIEKKVSAGI